MALKPESSPASPAGNSSFPIHTAVIVVVLVAGGAALWWFLLRTPPKPAEPPPLTEEAREYVRNGYLALSNVEMKAAENYMLTTLVEITGNIANKGPRAIAAVELNCIFYDPYGQVVLRQRVPIVRPVKGKPFQPEESRPFRLPFDNIPSGWNQMLPQLVIARIDFEN